MKSDGLGLFVACGLAACLSACHDKTDLVASCGVYDPAHLPQVLAFNNGIKGKDPCLYRDGDSDTYWLFATGPGLLVYKSTDHLTTFQKQDPVFASNPSWIAPLISGVGDLWSPQLIFFGNTVHLYYTAGVFFGDSCIGHARTHSLDQPFEDSGKPMLCATADGTAFDAVDPAVVLDDQGNPWMVFGSFKDGIHLFALDQTGERLDDKMITIAQRPINGNALQAAFIYRGPAYYYLFVSFDPSPGHSLRVGRSKQLKGPYLDKDGKDMLQGGGSILLQANNTFIGPGSNSIFDDNGCLLNAYHLYDVHDTKGNNPFLHVAPLVFDASGWPVPAGP